MRFLIALLALTLLPVINLKAEASRYLRSTPVLELAAAHLRILQRGDIITAYRLTSSDFKDATPLCEFTEMVAAMPQLKSFQGISLSSLSFEPGEAVWQGILLDKYGLPMLTVTYSVVLQDKSWRVQAMSAIPYTAPQDTIVVEPTTPKCTKKDYLRHS